MIKQYVILIQLECAFGVVGKKLDEQDLMEFIW
jgi:hypothetical protein